MKRLLLCASAVVAMTIVGCGKESAPGGPGAPPAAPQGRGYHEPEEHTFTVNVPSGTTNLDQGESKEVTISLDRQSEFNQAVTLKLTPPTGVTVTPNEIRLPGDEDDAKIVIDVAREAALGETMIDVAAVPETGKTTSVKMKIKIEDGN